MVPLDRRRTRRVAIPPLETQVGRERLDRIVPGRPLRLRSNNIGIKVHGSVRSEQRFGLHLRLPEDCTIVGVPSRTMAGWP